MGKMQWPGLVYRLHLHLEILARHLLISGYYSKENVGFMRSVILR